MKYANKKSLLPDPKSGTHNHCKLVMDTFGEPTRAELTEMLATDRDIMSTLIRQGVSDEEIYSRRFKKFDAVLAPVVSAECLNLLHKIF